MEIVVPPLGEGIESGSVVTVLVSPGDTIAKDQNIIEIETEKAVAPIPTSEAGSVEAVLVKEGDKVHVGQVLLKLKEDKSSSKKASSTARPVEVQAAVKAPRAPVMSQGNYQYSSSSGYPPPAGPAVRKLARDLGVDLNHVPGSARGGRITLSDVKRFVEAGVQPQVTSRKSIDFSKWGPVTKKKVSAIRAKIGEKMVESWTELPHVTQFAEADITRIMELRKSHSGNFKKKGGALTVTIFAIKVVLNALKKYPLFNSSLDENTGEIIVKNYHRVGIAVDTEAGLLVPVLKDTDKKSMMDISLDLVQLAEKARTRKITLDDIQGGTFTISNLGSIGGTHFTPIINKPEVAILGIGRGSIKPIWKNKDFEPRSVLPVALSYDHRVIDGADGARFIMEIVSGFENFDESLLGCTDSARSRAVAPISMASTPSEISSPALVPTIPMPSTLSDSGSRMSFVNPSVRSKLTARPEAAQGNLVTRTSIFCSRA